MSKEHVNIKYEKKNEWPFELTRIQWLWFNMKGLRALYIIAMFGTLVYNALQLTVPYFSSKLIDTFLSGEDAAYNLANHRDLFYTLIALMVGLTLFRVVIVYLDCLAYEKVSQGVLFRIRNLLYDKIQRQDMKFYSTYRTGDLMTRVTGDLDAVRHMIAWVVRMVVEAFSLLGAVAVYYFYMNWKLALCLLAVAPLIFLIIYLFKIRVAPMHALLREKLAVMNTIAQESISGNRVVKAFAKEQYEIDKFDECNTDYRETNKKTAFTWLTFFPYIESLANLLPVIQLLVGGLFLIKGSLTMGEYVAFSGLTWAIANPMRQLGNIMNEFQRFSAASRKVMEIYYSVPEIKDKCDAIPHPERFEGLVEFRDVTFKYSDGNLPVLKHVSFTANPGETVAIMGETGCGKTSLIHLIPRFYEPLEGRVMIDGHDVSAYKLKDLRSNIGLATQDVLLYSDTIDGNIAYGDSNLPKTDVIRYARTSAADDFIAKMPEGYETIVGERGVGLSGGQKQRISLARALAVKPSILILDDTTSAVDLETEKEIQHNLDELPFTCTKIIIAQRISTTKKADKILIMNHGEITESGTHEELIAKGGYYAELVKLQTGENDREQV
ncbi:ATP-binding cassette, subfamily B [Lachnospiraceae bacterium XBB2008]|nr:ATP-binding cassette, subfamily B [Lachnospiraceae bacterium XBB2008]